MVKETNRDILTLDNDKTRNNQHTLDQTITCFDNPQGFENILKNSEDNPYFLLISNDFHSLKDKFHNSSLHEILTLNPFPNKPLFLHVCSTSLLKTLHKK